MKYHNCRMFFAYLVPMPIPDSRVLQLADRSEAGDHVLHRCVKPLISVPWTHCLVKPSDILSKEVELIKVNQRITLANFLHSMSMFSTSMLDHTVVFHSSIDVLLDKIVLLSLFIN